MADHECFEPDEFRRLEIEYSSDLKSSLVKLYIGFCHQLGKALLLRFKKLRAYLW